MVAPRTPETASPFHSIAFRSVSGTGPRVCELHFWGVPEGSRIGRFGVAGVARTGAISPTIDHEAAVCAYVSDPRASSPGMLACVALDCRSSLVACTLSLSLSLSIYTVSYTHLTLPTKRIV